MRREGRDWIVNEEIRTPLVVGAGGHFCPVAKQLNPEPPQASLVVAQEVEFPVEATDAAAYAIAPERPELYFSRDLQGYGWCFRKGRHMNIGFGRLDRRSLPKGTAEFVEFLAREGRVPPGATYKWHGHAYLLASAAGRRVVDDGVVLVGDAAGLAYPQSGEGIRPAVESGLMAAETIVAARGAYGREQLSAHAGRLARAVRHRLGAGGVVGARARRPGAHAVADRHGLAVVRAPLPDRPLVPASPAAGAACAVGRLGRRQSGGRQSAVQ